MPKKKKSIDSKKSAIDKTKKSLFKKKKTKKKTSEKVSENVLVIKKTHISNNNLDATKEREVNPNTGEYTNVSPTNFAGSFGASSSPYSFPIDTLDRAKRALAGAHFTPSAEGIKRAVYKKFPSLNPKNKK